MRKINSVPFCVIIFPFPKVVARFQLFQCVGRASQYLPLIYETVTTTYFMILGYDIIIVLQIGNLYIPYSNSFHVEVIVIVVIW